MSPVKWVCVDCLVFHIVREYRADAYKCKGYPVMAASIIVVMPHAVHMRLLYHVLTHAWLGRDIDGMFGR